MENIWFMVARPSGQGFTLAETTSTLSVISSEVEKSIEIIKVNRTIKEPVWGY